METDEVIKLVDNIYKVSTGLNIFSRFSQISHCILSAQLYNSYTRKKRLARMNHSETIFRCNNLFMLRTTGVCLWRRCIGKPMNNLL